jgi:hypothetical protein
VSPPSVPDWLTQLIFYAGTACAAIYAGWKGYTSKKVAKSDSVRTAIVAGDLMDTKPMRDLAAAVERLGDRMQRFEDGQDRVVDAVNRNTDAERSTETAIRDMCRMIERSQR